MEDLNIINGIVIGGVGGAIAGITLNLISFLNYEFKIFRDKKRIFNWLQSNASGKIYRSTKEIASYNNLTMDRVRFICSLHKKIFSSPYEKEDLWSSIDKRGKSIYEERDLETM